MKNMQLFNYKKISAVLLTALGITFVPWLIATVLEMTEPRDTVVSSFWMWQSALSDFATTTSEVAFYFHLLLLVMGATLALGRRLQFVKKGTYPIEAIIRRGVIGFLCAATVFFTISVTEFVFGFDLVLTTIPEKPVIYLYPEQTQQIQVRVEFAGTFSTVYPAFNAAETSWNVTAEPSGKLTLPNDQRYYNYLFWEGVADTPVRIAEGFVVRREDTQAFLEWALAEQGLNDAEANDFIVYWLPELQKNPYNVIHFSTAEYEKMATLSVTPQPDTMIRVFMIYAPLQTEVKLPPQQLEKKIRTGFTVVEWGGSVGQLL